MVSIRPVEPADEAEFLAAVRASRRLHRPWVSPPADAKAFANYLARFDGSAHHGFVVVSQGQLAGAIHVTNIIMGAFRSGYLGYYAFAGQERRSLMTAGLNAVVRCAFKQLGLHRVEANIQPGNTASIALVKRCGFQREGLSPAYLKIGGRWRDHERWAKLQR